MRETLDQDHSLSLSDPDRSLVLSHFLTNFLQNLASCHTALRHWRDLDATLKHNKREKKAFAQGLNGGKRSSRTP
jgi:hypothetical protein